MKSADIKRSALFISHANPEDNAFTIWLGAKLTALGYEVWADVMRLRGGDDWERKLMQALRKAALKVLFVGTPAAAEKRGTRSELEIANKTATSIGDLEFIIPLQVKQFDPPFRIAHAQYIDFEHRGWAAGLAELLDTLNEKGIPRKAGLVADTIWLSLQAMHATTVVEGAEPLISSWLSVRKLPAALHLFEFRGQAPANLVSLLDNCKFAAAPYRNGFFSFAQASDLADEISGAEPIRAASFDVDSFLEYGSRAREVSARDARNVVTTLLNRSIDIYLASRNLAPFAMGNRQTAWWPPIAAAPVGRVPFRWGDVSGSRQIQGVSSKRQMHWHYGATFSYHSTPTRHVSITSRLIFTIDGRHTVGDAGRAHRLRRSWAKSWRNARWRDMMLAFLFWLAEGEDKLAIPVASNQSLDVDVPPMIFVSPVTAPEVDPSSVDDSADEDGALDDFDHDDEFVEDEV